MFKKLVLVFSIFILFFFANSSLIFSDEMTDLQNQIDQYSQKLTELGKSKNSLANQINILDSQMQLTLLKITQTQNSIKTLESDIADLTVKIDNLDVSLNQLTAVYINQITQNYKLQKKLQPLSNIFLSGGFNNFLEQYKYISVLQKKSQDTMVSMETVRTNFDLQKEEKNKKQTELEDLKTKLASQQLLAEAQSQLSALRNFSKNAGSTCLSSSPGSGNDGNFYSQRDPRWCNQRMGSSSDTIGEVGCYISSISMAYKKLGTNMTPSLYALDTSNFWSNTAFATNPDPPSGYTFKQIGYSSGTVDNELKNGRFVIAQMRMPGTAVGMHFIVIISGSGGNYKIHDPWYGPDLNFSEHYSIGSIMSLRLFTK